MLNTIRFQLSTRHYLTATTQSDWDDWRTTYDGLNAPERAALINLLAQHTAIPLSFVQSALASGLTLNDFSHLQSFEHQAMERVRSFQSIHCTQMTHLPRLEISRSEWLTIIDDYEAKPPHYLKINFIIDRLSCLRKVSYDSLLTRVKKELPAREAKRKTHAEPEYDTPVHYKSRFRHKDNQPNPLIADSIQTPSDVKSELETTGVRNTLLAMASPEKGYSALKRTPGGTKVRPVFNLKGITLFKTLTPYSTTPEEARADFRAASAQAIKSELPALNTQRVGAVEFTATAQKIKERIGMMRRDRSIMGASAKEVFMAHGIEVSPAKKNDHHWAHLIAHFLCDTSELHAADKEQSPNGKIGNLVASTAAANHNMQTIESFIRDSLLSGRAEQMHIHVEPSFSSESLIPDLLTYTVTWNEAHNPKSSVQKEIFYFNPQSYECFNKKMMESIKLLRNMDVELSEDDFSADFPPLPSF